MHIAIIGNGISGTTAARHFRKRDADCRITLISAETDHFFSRTALMYIYMGHMKYEHTKPYEDGFWKKNRIDLLRDYVERVDVAGKKLHCSKTGDLPYDKLVIAAGSKPNKFGWPGQDLDGVQGLYSYQDLEGMEKWSPTTKRAVVVGGGLIGIEMAEMFHVRGVEVTFLVREKSFWNKILPPEESEMVNGEIREHHIDLRLDTELSEILPDANGRVRAVKTKGGEGIDCQFVGLTVGVSPNIAFLEGSGIETNRGVKVNEFHETNVPDVYAIGDCAEFHVPPRPQMRNLEQVWYTGRMQAENLANVVFGERKPYTPGIWFNSAKFFNVEYQTYGYVKASLPEDEDSLLWACPSGKKAIRVNFRKADKTVVGFNLMGVRYRHEVCDRWMEEGRDLRYVVEHLDEANFDPEFFKANEPEMARAYAAKFPDEPPVKQRRKRRLREMLGL